MQVSVAHSVGYARLFGPPPRGCREPHVPDGSGRGKLVSRGWDRSGAEIRGARAPACLRPAVIKSNVRVAGDPPPARSKAGTAGPRLGPATVAATLAPPGATPLPTVSVVVPTFNEAPNLEWVLPRMPDLVTEVVVVDGGSSDGTRDVARRLRPDALIIDHPRRGKGNALATGFAASSGDIIVMLDADGSADPEEIPIFVGALLAGHDFAKGTRFSAGGGSDDITTFRRLGNTCLVLLVNLLYGTQYTDLCYGLNAFWRRCLPDVAPECDGFEVETFMNLRSAKAGLRVGEVGSFEFRRRFGMSKLHSVRDGSRILRTIVRERVASHTTMPSMAVPGPLIDVRGTPDGRSTSAGRGRVGSGAPLRVAFINNMPDRAFAATDRQFSSLLTGQHVGDNLQLLRYCLPAPERGPAVQAAISSMGYRPLASLYGAGVDALVVTGTEPTAPALTDEPFWDALAEVLEWGVSHTRAMLLSCLAAHAAAHLFDGVARLRLPEKCFGLRAVLPAVDAGLATGLPAHGIMPHSHRNVVPFADLLTHGYRPVLASGDEWSAVTKRIDNCDLLLLQGHPEYDELTLLREYRRDWRRFHLGTSPAPPQVPAGYLDPAGHAQLRDLTATLGGGPAPQLADAFPFDQFAAHVAHTWHDRSLVLYSNWYGALAAAANSASQSAPTSAPLGPGSKHRGRSRSASVRANPVWPSP